MFDIPTVPRTSHVSYHNHCDILIKSFMDFLNFRLFERWSKNEGRPASGSLVGLVTKDGQTEAVVV